MRHEPDENRRLIEYSFSDARKAALSLGVIGISAAEEGSAGGSSASGSSRSGAALSR